MTKPGMVSQQWRKRPALTGVDVIDFLALQQVCGRPDARLGRVGEQYFERDRRVLTFLEEGLTELIEAGHLALGDPEPGSGGIQRVMVTASGRARYEELCDKQGVAPYPHIVEGTVE